MQPGALTLRSAALALPKRWIGGGRRKKGMLEVLPNGPGIELPARECTTPHRPAAGESSRVSHPAVSGGRQLEGLASRAVAGQLQCLVRRQVEAANHRSPRKAVASLRSLRTRSQSKPRATSRQQ